MEDECIAQTNGRVLPITPKVIEWDTLVKPMKANGRLVTNTTGMQIKQSEGLSVFHMKVTC